jgi:predicted RNase H-like HicB family nuclease
MWLGYFEDFPDYLTQGETLEGLEETSAIFTRT